MFRLRNQSVWASDLAGYLNRDLLGTDFQIEQPDVLKTDLEPGRPGGPVVRFVPAPPGELGGDAYIVTENPSRDVALILLEFFATPRIDGVDPTARIHPAACLGRSVQVGAYSVIDAGVEIGDSTFIMNRVTIYGPARIGRGCVIKDGAVIGSEGYGFVEDEAGTLIHAPHLGSVVLGDQVWVGANSSVERGVLEETAIEEGAKLDDLVHVGKGARVGRNCRITAGAVIAFNVRIGEGCTVGPNASIRENLTVAPGTIVGQGCAVVKNIESRGVYMGIPARRRSIATGK